MDMSFSHINWLAILACVVAGQVFLTVWFAVIFAKPWAVAYGVDDPKQHTREVPGYTYGVGAVCVLLLSLGLAVLQQSLQVQTLGGGLAVGAVVALHFAIATALPGYAFLRRWRAGVLAIGSQVCLVLLLSGILAVMR